MKRSSKDKSKFKKKICSPKWGATIQNINLYYDDAFMKEQILFKKNDLEHDW